MYTFESDKPMTNPSKVETFNRKKDVPSVYDIVKVCASDSKKPNGLFNTMTYGNYDVNVCGRFTWTYRDGIRLLESLRTEDPDGMNAIKNALDFIKSNVYGTFNECGISIKVTHPEDY